MKYLLTFKPLKNFFFGNNKTFSEDYYAISEYFPQNTQLLGALRLYIAESNKLMHIHRNGKYSNEPKKLTKLVGRAGSKNFKTDLDLGQINNLSSMFIVTHDLDDAYFPTPFDLEISKESARIYTLSKLDSTYFLSDFDIKNTSSQHLGSKEFWQEYLNNTVSSSSSLKKFEDIFKVHTQVGIGLEKKETIEGAFYSKVDYSLDKEFLFGAVIELESDIIKDGIIQVGAESSLFELKVQLLDSVALHKHPVISQLFSTPKRSTKVVALSDIMMQYSDKSGADFALIPFHKNLAMLKSQSGNYHKFSGKTEQKRVLPQGSVFYFDEASTLKDEDIGAYKKMGYNQFLSINK